MNYLGQPFYVLSAGGGGTGDVVGPSTSTINAVPRFTDASGKELKNSVVIVSDTGAITGATSIETDAISAPSGTLNITAPTSFSLTTSAPTGINMNVSSVVVEAYDYAKIQAPDAYVEARGADVNIGSAGDVVIDTDGTVSLFGRASPTAVSISGHTELAGNLDCTGRIAMNASRITNLGAPTTGTDASTKQYVDDKFTAAAGSAMILPVAPAGQRDLFVASTGATNGSITGNTLLRDIIYLNSAPPAY